MIKVLHIIDSGGLYGAEIVLLNLVAEQIKLGLDPTIASIGEKHISEKPLETEALKRGFKVKKFRMFPGPNIAGAFKILQYAKSNDFDLLHSHGYKGNVAFGLLPRKLRKIPMVSTLHGWTSTNGFSKMRLYEWLDRKSLKYIDSVVLVSNAMKFHPKLKKLKGINFHVIPNGIPIPDSTVTQFNNSINQPFDKEIEDFCSKGFTIGAIGRLSPEKGYKNLIEALALLIKKGIDVRLIIIGEGDERGYLEGLMAKAELSDRVLMPGYRKNAKRYLSYFNVFVISSLTEGLPITLLEAMQAKVPIVATRVGGIPEALGRGKAGILVNTQNVQNLAQAINRLYRNSEIGKRLAEKAKKIFRENYSSRRMALDYLNIYGSLAKYRH